MIAYGGGEERDIRLPRSSKSSAWSSNPICRTPDAGEVRYPAGKISPMVRPLPNRRVRGAGRQTTQAKQVRNRIPDDVRGRIVRLALDEPQLSP